jgi:multidrug efflux pump subunit AcrA (membrane-fusion protein)
MQSLEIEVDVNESYINRVEPGAPVEATLDSYPDWQIPSKVIAIIPTADRQKATVKVRIAFDSLDPRILANMGVKVTFLDPSPASQSSAGSGAAALPVVRLPASAVQSEGGTSFVWRVRGDRVERIAVRVGAERGGQVEVLAGVNGGDLVVATPVAGLADGAAVAVAAR